MQADRRREPDATHRQSSLSQSRVSTISRTRRTNAPAYAPSTARWSNAQQRWPTGAMASAPSVVDDDLLGHAVGREDADLRPVDDRKRDPGAGRAGVRDREGAAREVVGHELAGMGAGGDVADGGGERTQAQAVGVVHDGYDQALEVEVDRDPEVHRAVHDCRQPVVGGCGVHAGELAERVDDGAGHERQRGETLGPAGAVDRRVVGRDHRQCVRNGALRREADRLRCGAGCCRTGRPRRGPASNPDAARMSVASDTTAGSSSEQRRGIDARLAGEIPDRGREESVRVARRAPTPRGGYRLGHHHPG